MASPVADSYDLPPGGGVISCGRFTAPLVSLNTALMGDSLTDDAYGLTTFYGINAGCGGKMVLMANSGVSGTTVGDMLGRVNNLYTAGAPGMAGIGTLGRIFVRAGTNDARGNTSIASLAASYTALLNTLATYAQRVIILAVPPLSDSGNNATAATYNAWLSAFAAANPSQFKYIDDCTSLRLGDGSQDPVCFNVDGIHFAGPGVARAGLAGAIAMASELASAHSPLSKSAADVYPAQPQWIQNPTIVGTGGGKDGAFSGQVANTFYVGGYGAGMGGVCSIVAANAGDQNQTPWQRVELTSGQVGSRLDIQTTLIGRSITAVDPTRLDAMLEIRFVGVNRSYVDGISLMAQGDTGEYFVPSTPLFLDSSGTESKTYVLRARRKRSGSSPSISYLGWHLYAGIRANFSSSVGFIDIRSITVRG